MTFELMCQLERLTTCA